MREEVEGLKHHADLAPDGVDVLQIVGQFDTVDDDAAFLMGLKPVDAADQGRLAGPGRAANDDPLAARDVEIDVLQHMKRAEPFVDTGQPNDRRLVRVRPDLIHVGNRHFSHQPLSPIAARHKHPCNLAH